MPFMVTDDKAVMERCQGRLCVTGIGDIRGQLCPAEKGSRRRGGGSFPVPAPHQPVHPSLTQLPLLSVERRMQKSNTQCLSHFLSIYLTVAEGPLPDSTSSRVTPFSNWTTTRDSQTQDF